jgi:hypothetical protein
MTKTEINQLLYIESRAVDFDGRINHHQMNDDDRRIMEKWAAEDYVEYGRIAFMYVAGDLTHYVKLSEQAWADAARYRRERAERCWESKNYLTANEKRNGLGTTTPKATASSGA